MILRSPWLAVYSVFVVALGCDDDSVRGPALDAGRVDGALQGDGGVGDAGEGGGDAAPDGGCASAVCDVHAKQCGAVPDRCGGSLDCGPCAVGLCGAVAPNACGCPDPSQVFSSDPRTARRARSAGFAGTVDQYAELFAVTCTVASDCDTACLARGGDAEMCQAAECLNDSRGGFACLPPPIWTNLESIQFESSSFSGAVQQVVVATPYRDALLVDGFSLEIPPTATVEGLTVEIRRASLGSVGDDSVRILKGGVLGTAERASGAAWKDAYEWASYGGPQDLWGETWTPADLNAEDFGVALSVLYGSSVGNARAYVDQVRVTVHYRVVCD